MSIWKVEIFVLVLGIVSSVGCTFQKDRQGSLRIDRASSPPATFPSEQNIEVDSSDVAISFSMLDRKLHRNQPVIIIFTIDNRLKTQIKLDLGARKKEAFLFSMTSPGGKERRLPPLPQPELVGDGLIRIEPQTEYSQELLLNEWTDFPEAGEYKLKAMLANEILTTNGKTFSVKAISEITFDIKGENPEALKAICEALLQRISISDGVEEKTRVSLALSFVKDPVAIPFLQKAITSKTGVERTIMNSLRDQGGDVAVEVLINVAKQSQDGDLIAQAKASLKWIERQTSDLALKQRISNFLKN